MAKQVTALLEALRPRDWVKNTFIFAGAVFAETLLTTEVLVKVLAGFILFSLGASSVYLLNDFMDVEFLADNPGRWFHHCHNLYHTMDGMANEVIYKT